VREIHTDQITETVARLCIESNYFLGQDVLAVLRRYREAEVSPVGREVLDQILENAEIARREQMPLCQDCGLTVIFLELGQDVHITGSDLNEAIAQGVREGYQNGYLRKSMVDRPFSARINTKDNTPPVIHTTVVPGNHLKIIVAPKGGGSENMSQLAMLKPADGREGVVQFVVEAVRKAGANPCPPIIVGVGVGGSAEKAVWLAKHSLLREVAQPVAVNIQCHSARHKEAVL
jgi:fumarate hydratase subunit alpha